MTDNLKILIATQNRGKAFEIISILENENVQNIDFVIPSDLNISEEPDEIGSDYESNAIIKARFYGEKSGLLSLADDSGLEVFALDGYPGIKSARMKSPENTDRSRYEILLDQMRSIPEGKRDARFVCVAAAFDPQTKEIIVTRGEWHGEISQSPEGEHGFGYDPVFYIPELNKAAAELSRGEKNRLSHRGKAFRLLWQKLKSQVLLNYL